MAIITNHAKRYKYKTLHKTWQDDLFLSRAYSQFLSKPDTMFKTEKEFEDWVSMNITKNHYRQCWLLSPCHPALKYLDICSGLYVIGNNLYRSVRVDIFIPETGTVIELKCVKEISPKLFQDLESQLDTYLKAKSVKQVYGFIFQQNPPQFISGKLFQQHWRHLFNVSKP